MTIDDRINDEYFEWLFDLVCGNRYSNQISFKKLITRLHSIEFRYCIPNDENRARDGEDLRYRFSLFRGYEDIPECLAGPCSVLEMMIALAIRIEESIMDDPYVGDRTAQWFWGMVVSLGLGSMMDHVFDKDVVDEVIERFLRREYEPNGKGGLFTIRNCDHDLRDVEIWFQLCWYLDGIA